MKRKKLLKILGIIFALFLILMALFPFFTYGVTEKIEAVVVNQQYITESPSLNIITLNVAHGRKDGMHQMLLAKTTIYNNLDAIVQVLQRENPHIVALQESDGPSIWSGNFNHIRYLAENTQMHFYSRGRHVQGMGLSYGTAILSKLPGKDSESVTFEFSWPTPSKGFIISTLIWENLEFDVVSIHLDFLSATVRSQQLNTLKNKLATRAKPLVVMGDFNCSWKDLQNFATDMKLSTYQADGDMPTFHNHTRIDWILISKEFKIIEYRVILDTLSDHKAVFAKLQKNK